MKNEEKYELVRLDPDIPVFMWLHPRGRTTNPRVIDAHWHRSLEFDIIWDDELLYYINGVEYRLDGESVCLINSMDVHRLIPQSERKGPEIIGFTLIIGYDFLKSLVQDIEESIFVLDGTEQTRAVRGRLVKMADIFFAQASPYWKAEIMEQVCGLIYYLCSSCKHSRSVIPAHAETNVKEVRAMMEYIQEHYTEDIRQQELSQRFFYSREYMSKLFKRYTKCTIKEYLTQYRLQQSERLLFHTDRSVTEIALTVGFNDAKQMIRAFRRYYDMTPQQFRRSGHWKP